MHHHKPLRQPTVLRRCTACVITVVALLLPIQLIADAPRLVSTFYGEVTVDGGAVPAGTPITARIEGVDYETEEVFTTASGSVFRIDVPGDRADTVELEGAAEGQTVTFAVGGVTVSAVGTWQRGGHQLLDLQAPVGSDLSISLDDGRANAVRGDTLTYTLTLDNPGPVEAPGLDIELVLPPAVTFLEASGGGALAGGGRVRWTGRSLAVGDSLVLTAEVRVPPAVPTAVTELRTRAEFSGDASLGFDPDLSNNVAEDFTVLDAPAGELPDLAMGVDNIVVEPAGTLLAGDAVEITLILRNAGLGAATDVLVVLLDGPVGIGEEMFRHTFTDVPASGNRSVTLPWTAPEGVSTLTAVVDPDNLILELSEDNNVADRELVAGLLAGPDLTVTAVDAAGLTQSPSSLVVSGSVGVSLANSGDADAPAPFTVQLFEDVDGDGRKGPRDSVYATATVSEPLAAGGSTDLVLDVSPTAGRFLHPLVWAEVDAGGAVAEQDETNNTRPVFGDCTLDVPEPSFEPVEEWHRVGVEAETAPIVVQLTDDNGDGTIDGRDTPDIVFPGDDLNSADPNSGFGVFAISGLDGSEVWTVRESIDFPLPLPLGNLAAGDLNGDGVAEVLAPTGDGRLLAIDHTGMVAWISPQIEGVGNRIPGSISVADLDGDGVPEIVVGRVVLSNTGSVLTVGNANRGRNENFYGPAGTRLVPGTFDYPHSIVADIDLDGRSEIIAGDAVYRWDGSTLELVWDHVAPNRLMEDGFSAVGNFDSDPEAEIVYVSSGQIMVLNHDGSVFAPSRLITEFIPFQMPTYWGSPPTVVDLDGDGVPEILVAGAVELVAFSGGLSPRWRAPIGPDFGNITSLTAFDFDGDGTREVLFADETTFHILDGATGQTLHTRPNTSKTASEYPIVADVDGDGVAEIVLTSNTGFDGDDSTRGIHVLSHPGWQGTRPVWNQYGASVTNVLADGTVPSAPVPSFAGSGAAGNSFRVNRQLPPPRPWQSNLTLSMARVGSAGPGGVPITLRLGNGGGGFAPPGVELSLYVGDPSTIDPAVDTPVLVVPTEKGLRPGAFEDVVIPWQVPTAGPTQVSAFIDVADGVDECLETDNRVDFLIDELLLPDLRVTDLAVPEISSAGALVPVTFTVRNDGLAIAGASLLRLEATPEGGSLALAAEVEAPALAVGEARELSLLWDTRHHVDASYDLRATVDAEDAVIESEEGNNFTFASGRLVAPVQPDLSAERLRVDPASATEGGTVDLTAEVINRGADLGTPFDVAFRVNGAEVARVTGPTLASGEATEVSYALDTLGRPGVLALRADLDPSGAVNELDESNNLAFGEAVVSGSGYGLTLTTDRFLYSANTDVAFDLGLSNGEAADANLDLLLRVVDPSGATLATVLDESIVLAPGASTRNALWNTAANAPGPYTVIAELLETDAGGSTVRARAVSNLSIAPDLRVLASILADRGTYTPDATVTLQGAVTNEGVNITLDGLASTVAVLDAASVPVFETDIPLPPLAPGASAPFESMWSVAGAEPGDYRGVITVRDDQGRLLAVGSTDFVVESSSETGAGLTGDLAVAPTPVGAGAPLVGSWEVSHGGNADFMGLPLRLDLVDRGSEEVIAFNDTLVDLPRDETAVGGHAFDTLTLPEGDYLMVLSALVPAGPVQLDVEPFTVERGVSIADASVQEGDSGSRLVRFDVTLSSPADGPITVRYETRDSNAMAPLDYVHTEGELTFLPGETVRGIEVAVLGDLDVEVDETFMVILGETEDAATALPTGTLLGDPAATGTILDEEGCASVNLLNNPSFEEVEPDMQAPGWDATGRRRFADPEPIDGAAYFTYPGAHTTQTPDVSGLASVIDQGLVTFVAGVYIRLPLPEDVFLGEFMADLTLVMLNEHGEALAMEMVDLDPAVDGWQMLSITLDAPVGTRFVDYQVNYMGNGGLHVDRASLHVLGQRTLVVGDVTQEEGNGAGAVHFPVTLSCPATAPLTVDYTTVDDTAQAGSDYTATSGSLTFAVGEFEKTIIVPVLGDPVHEYDESFGLVLDLPVDLASLDRSATATLVDDDLGVSLSVGDATVLEGDGGSMDALVDVTLSAPSGRMVRVDYATADGTALSDVDYDTTSGTLTFAPGEILKTVRITVHGDVLDEADETADLVLSNPVQASLSDATGTLTVRDDDEASLVIGDATVLEGDDGDSVELVFPVTLTAESGLEVQVSWRTVDGPAGSNGAVAGEDYTAATGSVTLPAGTLAGEIRVSGIGDTVQESHETFLVELFAPVHVELGRSEATGTLFDDDGVLISVRDTSVNEVSPHVQVQIELNRASAEDVEVDVTTVDGSATAGLDYQALAETLVIPAGTTLWTLDIPIFNDTLLEEPEDFDVTLSAAMGGELYHATARIQLFDDDQWAFNRFRDRSYPTPYKADGCVQLTGEEQRWGSGAAWHRVPLDLTESFDKTVRVFMGAHDAGGSGMTFGVQARGLDANGQDNWWLGRFHNNVNPSYGVEWRTAAGRRELDNHMSIIVNNSGDQGNPAVVVVEEDFEGTEHVARLMWNAETQIFRTDFNGRNILRDPRDVVGTIFGGNPEVYWGFTAGNSSYRNEFYFCDTAACTSDSGAPLISIGDVQIVEGDPGDTVQAIFAVTLSCPTDAPVSVDFTTVDGTALAGEDFTAATGTLTFAPGEVSQYVVVDILEDTKGGVHEDFTVELSAPQGGTLRYATGHAELLSDDALILVETRSIVEGDTDTNGGGYPTGITQAVRLAGPIVRPASVRFRTYAGTASPVYPGRDYVEGTLVGTPGDRHHNYMTFLPGETERFIQLRTYGDFVEEEDENFFLELYDPEHAEIEQAVHEIVIIDDDEGCPTSPNLLFNGSAQHVNDDTYFPGWTFEGPESRWSHYGRFAADRFGGTFAVAQCGDPVNTMYQDVDVSGFAGRIDLGLQAFRFEGHINREGCHLPEGAIELYFLDVTRQEVLAYWDSREDVPRTYILGHTWPRAETLQVAPPGTRFIRVRVVNSGKRIDAMRLVSLKTPLVSAGDVSLVEGDAGVQLLEVPVSMSCDSPVPVSVDYFTADGLSEFTTNTNPAAMAPADYSAVQGTLVFAPGELAKTVSVPIHGDVLNEGNETFRLLLTNVQEAGVGDLEAELTVIDDEVFVDLADARAAEGDSGTTPMDFTVTLSRASDLEVRLDYTTGDRVALAGEDYLESVGTLVIPPGETTGTISVPMIGDTDEEADECLDLVLTGAINATLDRATALGCIANDDLLVSVEDRQIGEGDTGPSTVLFTVSLSQSSTSEVRVDYATVDVEALAGEDYEAASGTLVFAPGVTQRDIPVQVLGDEELESTETFVVQLSAPVAAHLGDSEGVGFIVDDDGCQSLSLLRNGGAEDGEDDITLIGWEEVRGTEWHPLNIHPTAPFEGFLYMHAGNATDGELRQDVDVSGFARWIDQGIQRFAFEGYMRSLAEPVVDTGEVIVEYRDATNETVLSQFASGPQAHTESWLRISDVHLAPPGTRFVRVRLLSRRNWSSRSDAYFDFLTLRSLGTPTLEVDDPQVVEGDAESTVVTFDVSLGCPSSEVVTVDYVTRDFSARDGADYLGVSGSLTFEPGEQHQPVEIEVLGDIELEPAEDFELVLSAETHAVLVKSIGTATIFDNETSIENLPLVSMQTDPGDGQVAIDVGAFGDWGTNLMRYVPGKRYEGDSLYDVPGDGGRIHVAWESNVFLRHPGHEETYLTAWRSSANTNKGELPLPGFLRHGERFAESIFQVGHLFFHLRQSLHDMYNEETGERDGGVLVQTYTVTNKLPTTTSFELFRYFETDMGSGYGDDGGGYLEVNGKEFIFAVDRAGFATTEVPFAGIIAEGGVIPETGRYELHAWHGLADRVARGENLRDLVHRDSADEDLFVDPGWGYDIGMMFNNRFPEIAPEETVTYNTLTYFGTMPPADFDPDVLPLAVAGRYQVLEGQDFELDASQSFDIDGTLVAYEWDLDGDGEFDDASGERVPMQLFEEGRFPVALRVTDDGGQSAIDDGGEILVINGAPSLAMVADFEVNETVSQVLASFVDGGGRDTHTATVDWGDGTTTSGTVVRTGGGLGTFSSGTVAGEHTYSAEGEYTITVCVTDDAGATACGSVTVTIDLGEPLLVVYKTAELSVDFDGDGLAAPGDEIRYRIEIHNIGTTAATGVLLEDVIPTHTTPVDGTVEASQGVIFVDGSVEPPVLRAEPGPVDVTVDEAGEPLAAPVTVSFTVRVDEPFPVDVPTITNQATVTADDLPALVSDDPSTAALDDPTVTAVFRGLTTVCEAQPFVDLDADGQPDGWSTAFLGDADQGGTVVVEDLSTMAEDNRLEITGDGTSLYRADDNAVFVYRTMDGDFRLEMDLTGFPVDAGGDVRKAGLMARAGLDPRAPRVMVNYIPHLPDPVTSALQFEYRDAHGIGNDFGLNVHDMPWPTPEAPVRLALQKRGQLYTALYSLDGGATWNEPGGAFNGSIAVDLGNTVQVGMAVASYDANVTLTAEFGGATVCRPNPLPPTDPPPAPACDPEAPLDVVYLLDLSGSMTFTLDDGTTRLAASQQALQSLSDQLALRGDGSRAALVTFAGFRGDGSVEANLADGAVVVSGFTDDFHALDTLVQGIDPAIPGNTPSPTALGLREALKLLLDDRASTPGASTPGASNRQPAVVFLSDGIVNIDGAGRGPDEYALEDIQAIPLRDARGAFLPWTEVAWLGDFNPGLGTFDGEPLANVMFELEQLSLAVPGLLTYGIAFPGDGQGLGTYHDELMEYAAWFSGGKSFRVDATADLMDATDRLLRDLTCSDVGTASVGGTVWNDLDGDGVQGAGEPGLSGVTVELDDGASSGVAVVATGGDGSYAFDDLPADTYTVAVVTGSLPADLTVPTHDLDGLDTPHAAAATVADGESRNDLTFGYQRDASLPPGPSCVVDTFGDGTVGDPWTFSFLGNANLGGAAEVAGRLELTGNGTSLYRADDNAAFLHQTLAGDFRIEVDVTDIPVDTGGAVRKGGLMVRASEDVRAPRVMVNYIPHLPDPVTTALQFEYRGTDGVGDNFGLTIHDVPLPVRLAIERVGDTFTATYSLDGGATWRRPGGAFNGEVTIDMGPTALAGLAVASYDASTTMTLAFDEASICQ